MQPHARPATPGPPTPVVFEPLRREHFPLLARWLEEPRVKRWWNQESSPEAIEREFGPSVDGRDETRMFLAATAGRRFGFIQRYPIAAYQEYVDELTSVCTLPPGALSIDYFIGEPDLQGRGLGPVMIAAFVEASWAVHPEARHVVVPVSAANRASWRCLEHAGFRRIAEGELEPDNPRDSRDHYLYGLQRAS